LCVTNCCIIDLPTGILDAMHLYHAQTLKTIENKGDCSYFSSVRTSLSDGG